MTKKMGDLLGVKSKAVLGCLSKYGPKTRLELDSALHMVTTNVLSHLGGMFYTKRGPGNVYEITNRGRIALGEHVELPKPKDPRYCNAAMRETYDPARHAHHGRIGLARIG